MRWRDFMAPPRADSWLLAWDEEPWAQKLVLEPAAGRSRRRDAVRGATREAEFTSWRLTGNVGYPPSYMNEYGESGRRLERGY